MQAKDEYGVQIGCTIKHFLHGENLGGVDTASMYGGINHVWKRSCQPVHSGDFRLRSWSPMRVSIESLAT